MPSWISSVIFPVVVIGLILLAMMASENNNMTMCWFWLAVVGMAIIVQLAF